jgi:DNA-binding transcriptional LysR family regulator
MDKNLQKYAAFVKTVETGSLTRAAALLHYSQSGVSRMIADLEQEWGVTLLERGKAGVVLTGDGARLLPHARALCAEYARLSAEVDALPGRAHISAATRQFLRYLDRRNAPEAPAGCTGFDNRP